MSLKASIGDKLKRAKSWEKLSAIAEEWRQSRSHDLDSLLLDLNQGWLHKNRPQVARAAIQLRVIHEKLVPALGSVVRESCWTEEEDTPEERAHWAAVRKETEERVAIWLKDFLSAIRHLELGLMFDEAATVNKAVTALPPAKKDLFANIGKMLAELKREDS
jgi:hypothetical protein